MKRRSFRWISTFLLASLLAVASGCAAAIVGACAGAGTLGYLYYNGVLYRDYPASLAVTAQGVKAALRQLEFPITGEKSDTGTATITTRTADGHNVSIYMNVIPSAIPAEGALTRVGIRVGFAGDDVVSAKILDEITRQIAPSSPVASAPPPGPPAAPAVKPPETTPPPLASTTSKGSK
jgi:hypothetical protein